MDQFDLDKALAAWRRTLEYDSALRADDLDELEQHLRDQVAGLVGEGLTEKSALDRALREMGDHTTAVSEYGKIYWAKRRRRGEVLRELAVRTSMVKNYLKIALRNLRRQKGYAAINVFGLTAALAACLILGLYITQSLSYDRFHADADRIVRIVQESDDWGGNAIMPPGMARALESRFPEVEVVTQVLGDADTERTFTHGDLPIRIDEVMTVDEHFFDVFSFSVLRGDAETALRVPNQLIITATTARRLYGDADPIGETLHVNGTTEYTVAAVAADPPPNTHLPFNIIRSLSRDERGREEDEVMWNYFHGRVYVKLAPGVDRAAFTEKLNELQAEQRTAEQGPASTHRLQPITNIHLRSNLNGEYAPTSDIRYLYIFGAAGLIILLIACMNYVNLATAQSMQRAKEVGIRRVAGARRAQLMGQFLGESMLLVLVALLLAIAATAAVLPSINELTGQSLSLWTANRPPVWLGVLALITIVGIGAGGYPAFVISSFRALRIPRGTHASGYARPWMRRGLVIFQFAASFALVAGALVVYAQMRYLQTERLGFDTDQIITFSAPTWRWSDFDVLKASLDGEPSVQSIASGPPLGINFRTATMRPAAVPGSDERWELDLLTVGYDYLETVGLQLLAGRSFSPDIPTDVGQSALVTASAVDRLGLEGNGVGAFVEPFGEKTVIGVVDDFHNVTLREPLRPTIIVLDPTQTGAILARLAPGHTEAGLAAVERAWEALVPDRPFIFEFLDNRIQAQYVAERRLGRIFGLFAGLAVVLAALGLLGLAAFAAQQRTKEIGIRKVLGATVLSIVGLLTREFLMLVGVAILVAVPLAYIGTDRWLQEFAYHIDLGPGVFLAMGALAIAIALVSVSVQAIRAANTNPVEALRYE